LRTLVGTASRLTAFFRGGFFQGGFFPRGFFPGGLFPGGFYPDIDITTSITHVIKNLLLLL